MEDEMEREPNTDTGYYLVIKEAKPEGTSGESGAYLLERVVYPSPDARFEAEAFDILVSQFAEVAVLLSRTTRDVDAPWRVFAEPEMASRLYSFAFYSSDPADEGELIGEEFFWLWDESRGVCVVPTNITEAFYDLVPTPKEMCRLAGQHQWQIEDDGDAENGPPLHASFFCAVCGEGR